MLRGSETRWRAGAEDARGHEIPALRERIEPLREALAERERARGDEPEGVMVLFADVGTRQSTIVDLVYTRNRVGFRAYALAVVADMPLFSPFSPGCILSHRRSRNRGIVRSIGPGTGCS